MPPCEGELVQVAENLIVEAGTQLREGLTVEDIEKDITINHNKKYFSLIMITIPPLSSTPP